MKLSKGNNNPSLDKLIKNLSQVCSEKKMAQLLTMGLAEMSWTDSQIISLIKIMMRKGGGGQLYNKFVLVRS